MPKPKASKQKLPSRSGEAALLKRLRALCQALPEATEKLSHGEPTWFAGPKGKVFAMFDNHHHGAPRLSVHVPAPPGLQDTLVKAEPERYWVPPYVGHLGWVGIYLDGDCDWTMVKRLVTEGFCKVASAKLLARL